MTKVVIHPSSRQNAKLLLLSLLENVEDVSRLAVLYRDPDEQMVIDCDHNWTDEDIAYAMALMPIWFKETWSSEGDDE